MKVRTVKPRGRINFRGRVFAHEDLVPRVGEQVLVMRDESIGEADCIVFDLESNEHVCNAHNARRWAELTRGIDAEISSHNASIALAALLAFGCSTAQNGVQPVAEQPVYAAAPITGIVARALVVGMLQSRFAGPCPGADVDADIAAALFSDHGIAVTRLADAECTRAAALSAIGTQICGASPGSLLVLFWSGHGGQQPDLNGDETDGLDEYLCPDDEPLLDDDLAAAFDTVPAGVRCLAIFDTCNAGTMARRALRTPRFVNQRSFRASMIVFAGCADGKYSYGSAQGCIWTTAIIDAWRDGISYRDWFDSALKLIDSTEQLPQWTTYGDVSSWENEPALR